MSSDTLESNRGIQDLHKMWKNEAGGSFCPDRTKTGGAISHMLQRVLEHASSRVLVLRMRGLTLEQIGKTYAITRERVRQIERQALAALRERLQ